MDHRDKPGDDAGAETELSCTAQWGELSPPHPPWCPRARPVGHHQGALGSVVATNDPRVKPAGSPVDVSSSAHNPDHPDKPGDDAATGPRATQLTHPPRCPQARPVGHYQRALRAVFAATTRGQHSGCWQHRAGITPGRAGPHPCPIVIARLVRAIHSSSAEKMDHRDKPGDDAGAETDLSCSAQCGELSPPSGRTGFSGCGQRPAGQARGQPGGR